MNTAELPPRTAAATIAATAKRRRGRQERLADELRRYDWQCIPPEGADLATLAALLRRYGWQVIPPEEVPTEGRPAT